MCEVNRNELKSIILETMSEFYWRRFLAESDARLTRIEKKLEECK